jgi:hypothetical protein
MAFVPRNGLLGSKREHSQFARETMSTNKLVCQLCAEFIPATRAAEQNHRLTVGHPTSDRDFFSTHFDINYLPDNQARTEALWEPSENGGRAACDGGRRVTFVARFCWSMPTVFSRGERVETRTILCRSVEGQILSVSDMEIYRQLGVFETAFVSTLSPPAKPLSCTHRLYVETE